MNSGTLTYKLPTFTGMGSHGELEALLLRDWNIDHTPATKHSVDVQVRSGDYFVTLATVLDELANNLESYAQRVQIEGVVSDLIYLQDSYSIVKKNQSSLANND
jgi:hypothetical protein